jgi:hypothetical protein
MNDVLRVPAQINWQTGLNEAQRAHLKMLLERDRDAAPAPSPADEELDHEHVHAPAPSAAENLDELERDQRQGRTAKIDFRVSPDERHRWDTAARQLGLSTSEFVRDVVNQACEEILASEAEIVGTS